MATHDAGHATLFVDLGGERIRLEQVECVEQLGRPFLLVIDMLVRLGEVDLLPHLRKPIALALHETDESTRRFHGLLTEAEFQRESLLGYHYRLTARPFTHFMDQNRAFAIFQDKSSLEIVKKVFEDAGARDVDYSHLSRSYASRSYCVQYGESDFAFISRLLEEEGIYYFYRHEADKHVLVLCDGPSSHARGVPATLHYNPQQVSAQFALLAKGRRSYVQKLFERVSSGGEAKVTLRDFDFEKPARPLHADWSEAGHHHADEVEVYDYPGRYVEEARGNELSKSRLAALRAERQLYIGETHSMMLACGSTVHVAEHPLHRLNADYLVTRTVHSLTIQTPRAGAEEGEKVYNTRFEAVPATTHYHSPRLTPRPQVRGLETAIVSGPAGETIYTDKYGRVKVRFPWDRSDSPDDKSTCWIRVAQFGNLGSVILPRVGQEVMVDFLHGDPDRPIVCGWTFNAALMPVYELPANKTRALWRTKRYGETGQYPDAKPLDTGAPGANELRFEDKGGSEEVFLHAERDMNTRIRFAETHHVGQNQAVMVGHNRDDDVGNNEKANVGHDQELSVGNNQKETVGAKREIKIGSTDELTVGQSLTIKAGTTIEVSAGTSITLKVADSSIVIDATGVTIKGMAVSAEGNVTAALKAPMTNVEASAMTTIKGGVVMIN